MENIEKLAICQAFFKKVGEQVGTKDPGNLRGQVDAEMVEMYYKMGAKSFDINLLGEKVGSYSITVSKPKESKERTDLEITDRQAMMEWAYHEGFLVPDMGAITKHFLETGEVEGCRPITVVEPALAGGEVSRTTLTVDAAKVSQVLGNRLEVVAQQLLEGEISE